MDDTTAMTEAMRAASMVRTRTSPNPWVGAAVIDTDGCIVGVGRW